MKYVHFFREFSLVSACLVLLCLTLLPSAPALAAPPAAEVQQAAATLESLAHENTRQAQQTRDLATMEQSELKAHLHQLKKQAGRPGSGIQEAPEATCRFLGHAGTAAARPGSRVRRSQDRGRDNPGGCQTGQRRHQQQSGRARFTPNGGKPWPRSWTATATPGVPAIRSLVDVRFDQIDSGRAAAIAPGQYMSASGQPAQGDVLRLGLFTAIYRDPSGNIGYLKLEEGGERLAVVPEVTDWLTTSSIDGYISGKSEAVPMDISHGAVFARLMAGKDTREWVRAGGLLLWPILAAGALGLFIGLERLVFLMRQRKGSRTFYDKFMEAAQKADWQACRNLLANNGKSPASRVLARLIKEQGQGPDVLEATLQESMLEEMPRLERYLSTLQVLAVISPLLGLLGTVTGMINTFQVITVFGTGDPRLMSGGISEALVTTQAGLGVAIPIMLIAHFLKRRVAGVLDDMDAKGTAFTALLLRQKDCPNG